MKSNTLIFIADDDAIILKAITYYLRQKGFDNIQTFSNTTDCWAAAQEQKPQLCIIDYYLGDDDGWELCKNIQAIAPDTIPILLSGQEDVRLLFQLIREGLRHYIAKDETMLDTLEQILVQLRLHNTQPI